MFRLTLLSLLSSLALSSSQSPSETLAAFSVQMVSGCHLKATDGTLLFTPDGSHSYGAQWTRDFAYMLANAAPAAFNASFESTVRGAVEYTLKGQRADGCFPDRVYKNGWAVYMPDPSNSNSPFTDHAIDNMPFATLLVSAYMQRYIDVNATAAKSLFCTALPRLEAGLAFLSYAPDGLVYNDPAAPNRTYGFTDTVAKQGKLLFSSLLVMQAHDALARWAAVTGCGNATQHAAAAARLRSAVPAAFYNQSAGLFMACDVGANALPDVWGSALAVYLNATASAEQATQVVDTFVQNEDSLFQQGQLRHLPAGVFWGKCFTSCPTPGTYQNGAFWATPLSWVAPMLARHGQTAFAARQLQAVADSFTKGGVMECINADLGYHGVEKYVDSATNAYAGSAQTVM